ncbi:MAG: AmmeMemoRadiSam system protein B [Candidatus Gastranaerophilales bacterium]|nr:AmmeMemoRadiSam system protein B [Candidatus Gastranaerophilales bacterium]
MNNIKNASVAGIFYPLEKDELEKIIESFDKSADFSTRAVIVPHAGYIYSGSLAMKGIAALDRNVKNIFIIAPAHKVYFTGLCVSEHDLWQTPFGTIQINQEICAELKRDFQVNTNNEAFEHEHSIEVQIPLIQALFNDVKIVPVLTGNKAHFVSEIISEYYQNKENAFIISSDLSHFLKYDEAKKVDNLTSFMIETLDTVNFNPHQACGAAGVLALCDFARKNNFSMIRLGMKNSGDVTNNKTQVVGYGAWGLYEGKKNEFIKKYYSDLVLEICKKSIQENKKINVRILGGKNDDKLYPAVFDETGASFVTLEKNGHLRGCIGSIIAHKSLYSDLISNAKASAYNDPRFNPVSLEEINEIKIAVSLLSNPMPIEFGSENELLNEIRAEIDGIIIKDKEKRAVYLPSVWEQIPDKRMFLNSLKIKAGFSENYFSETFEAYRFETVYIKE